MSLDTDLLTMRFENLFGGDKTLSDSVHQVVSDNWREVFEDVKGGYEAAFAEISLQISQKLFGKLSIDELFGE